MSATKIIACDCQNAQQDNLHGKGRRVHNANEKDGYVCTVCSHVHMKGEAGGAKKPVGK